jgi:hypothetical protein
MFSINSFGEKYSTTGRENGEWLGLDDQKIRRYFFIFLIIISLKSNRPILRNKFPHIRIFANIDRNFQQIERNERNGYEFNRLRQRIVCRR